MVFVFKSIPLLLVLIEHPLSFAVGVCMVSLSLQQEADRIQYPVSSPSVLLPPLDCMTQTLKTGFGAAWQAIAPSRRIVAKLQVTQRIDRLRIKHLGLSCDV
ncbi:hypothetical protein [Oculatella sp. LEGE 06141]|uniref:hypothetical protein n=2 Tax=Oculatella sp. LEGE 06141 TaxID=1828648 RepID=UPI001880DDCF|nr:hypothetical protein [Oculatella sp. LEGE 06141]